jgi:uridine phosphorylase
MLSAIERSVLGLDIACPVREIVPLLERELTMTGWRIRSGQVWTTDAPYRETTMQLKKWADERVLAVEMQVASLFAFAAAKGAAVASVAVVSNAVDHDGEQFDSGSQQVGLNIIAACARTFKAWREKCILKA